jgi:hypothetical protein
MFPLPKGRKHNNRLQFNRTKKQTSIKMTVEHDSLTRLTNKILIVDDHPFIIQGYKNGITGINQKVRVSYLEAKDCESAII